MQKRFINHQNTVKCAASGVSNLMKYGNNDFYVYLLLVYRLFIMNEMSNVNLMQV